VIDRTDAAKARAGRRRRRAMSRRAVASRSPRRRAAEQEAAGRGARRTFPPKIRSPDPPFRREARRGAGGAHDGDPEKTALQGAARLRVLAPALEDPGPEVTAEDRHGDGARQHVGRPLRGDDREEQEDDAQPGDGVRTARRPDRLGREPRAGVPPGLRERPRGEDLARPVNAGDRAEDDPREQPGRTTFT